MAPLKLFFFFAIFLFFLHPSANAKTCPRVVCGPVIVDFPFRLSQQPSCCGNPNFNLSCEFKPRIGEVPVIRFPFAGEFGVYDIDEFSTPNFLRVRDPDGCTAKRFLPKFNFSGTPFEPMYSETYIFFNCSNNVTRLVEFPAMIIYCLSVENFSVVAIPSTFYNDSSPLRSCRHLATNSVPLQSPNLTQSNLNEFLLTWKEPDCSSSCSDICESPEERCLEYDYGCPNKKHGISKSTKYGLIIGLGALAFLLVVVFVIYHNSRRNYRYQQHQQNPSVEISGSAEPQLAAATAANGLDRSRIEAYPITFLGESCRLPRPNDNTCSICLSEYKAKETIRTITECDHYFHSNCIDEWLKLHATCPVCRNSPDQETALITNPALSSSSPPP
ncbi:Zinc finger, RING-type [Corchorus capsularis]|uniref:RING-type E3 ubiquitin transferase n=1 Tax=Corchorus capsularis TaxID=210143 RepID=A0A1R3IB24_COCAP|nr:Zinc finger, RING-type [Corchorus capsularis]